MTARRVAVAVMIGALVVVSEAGSAVAAPVAPTAQGWWSAAQQAPAPLPMDAVTGDNLRVGNDPTGPNATRYPSVLEAEARALGVQLQRVDAGTPEAISDALALIAHSGAEALMIQNNAMFHAHRQHILAFARTHRLPTVCGVRTFAEAGCLMAYAPNLVEMFRRAAIFVDKILKGATPADLPMERPQKLELVLNLTTAEALGVAFAPTLLTLADEVLK